VWVFVSGNVVSGAFSTLERAEEWISRHALTGLITAYPVDHGVYDWAVENSFFHPKKEHHGTPHHIATFSGGALPHVHYEEGKAVAGRDHAIRFMTLQSK